MKPVIGLLLALGALIGLFGQEAAYARAAGTTIAVAQMAAGDADCMTQMRAHDGAGSEHCQRNALDCITAMGCTIPLAFVNEHRLQGREPLVPQKPSWPRSRALVGVDVAPELEPPLRQG